jgi:hypothetical protein
VAEPTSPATRTDFAKVLDESCDGDHEGLLISRQRVARQTGGGRWSPAVPGEQGCSAPVALQIHRQHGFGLVLGLQPTAPGFTVVPVKILQIAPALHGAQMQSTEGSYPVVVWALVENDDGSDEVIGLAVGGNGDRAPIPPEPGTFETYRQSG